MFEQDFKKFEDGLRKSAGSNTEIDASFGCSFIYSYF